MSGSNIRSSAALFAPLDDLPAGAQPREVYSALAQVMGGAVLAQRVLLLPSRQLLKSNHKIIEWTLAQDSRGDASAHSAASDEETLELALALQEHTRGQAGTVSVNSPADIAKYTGRMPTNGLASERCLAKTISHDGRTLSTAIAFRGGGSPLWSVEDTAAFDEVCRRAAPILGAAAGGAGSAQRPRERAGAVSDSGAELEARLEHLIDQSDAILFHTNIDNVITFISGRAGDFFGIPPEDFTSAEVRWFELVHLDDRKGVTDRLDSVLEAPRSFEEECRVVNHMTGAVRWILFKFAPVVDDANEVIGWDAFGIDTTRRREAQESSDSQTKKIRALYTVASAIRGFLDPANIAARGLSALCEATSAEAGLCYLLNAKEDAPPELVAHHGFSQSFAQSLKRTSTPLALSTFVAEHGESLVIPDMRTDPRASRTLAEQEGMRSALLVPISVEENILGVIALFHRAPGVFGQGDVMLVGAAANQIGLAARQANLFAAYRRQTKNLAALYRLSHELTGSLTLDQIFQKAFVIIRDELGIKRMWLGLLNETGTRIIGQAAFGPGWKRRLVEINVEVAGRDHPIADVVTKRVSRIIDDPDRVLNEFGARRFFSRFSIRSVGLVPLISAGQLLGVLAFQPSNDSLEVDTEELGLVGNLGSEIASVVLSKRLDERIGEAEKMRSAGLLAAGIAHNFNNLLQAILGQASLLEMQAGDKPQVARALQIINESAAKGATLVRQLMSFAHLEEPNSEIIDVNTIIERSKKALVRNLKAGQFITYSLGEELPRADVDSGQILRILLVLVTNASEASPEGAEIEIFSDFFSVDRDRPHFEVPFGEYLRVGVRDHGIGMDEETKRRCFEPFFTTKNVDPSSGLSMSGAGLGLAAAFALSRKNGGRLVVDSRKGYGSVFTLYVPVARAAAAKGEVAFGDRRNVRTAKEPASKEAPRSSSELKVERAEAPVQVAKPAAPAAGPKRRKGGEANPGTVPDAD